MVKPVISWIVGLGLLVLAAGCSGGAESSDATTTLAAGELPWVVDTEIDLDGGSNGTAFVADDSALVLSPQDAPVVYELSTGEVRRLPDTLHHPSELDLSPNGVAAVGSILISTGQEDEAEILVVDVASGEELRRFELSDAVTVSISDDGTLLAASLRGSTEETPAAVWDIETGEQVFVVDPALGASLDVDLSGDGSTVVLAGESVVEVWDVETSTRLASLATVGETPKLALSPDETIVAVDNNQGDVLLWEWETDTVVSELTPTENDPFDFEFNHDGSLLVGVAWPQTVMWDTASGEVVQTFQSWTQMNPPQAGSDYLLGDSASAAFSADGQKLAIGDSEHGVTVWKPNPNNLG